MCTRKTTRFATHARSNPSTRARTLPARSHECTHARPHRTWTTGEGRGQRGVVTGGGIFVSRSRIRVDATRLRAHMRARMHFRLHTHTHLIHTHLFACTHARMHTRMGSGQRHWCPLKATSRVAELVGKHKIDQPNQGRTLLIRKYERLQIADYSDKNFVK